MLIKQRKRWMYFKFLRKFVSFWIEAEQDSLTVYCWVVLAEAGYIIIIQYVSFKNGDEMYLAWLGFCKNSNKTFNLYKAKGSHLYFHFSACHWYIMCNCV